MVAHQRIAEAALQDPAHSLRCQIDRNIEIRVCNFSLENPVRGKQLGPDAARFIDRAASTGKVFEMNPDPANLASKPPQGELQPAPDVEFEGAL